jgi:hypothetical protein
MSVQKYGIQTTDMSNFCPLKHLSFPKYVFCSKFGKVTVKNLAFCNLGFGKKRRADSYSASKDESQPKIVLLGKFPRNKMRNKETAARRPVDFHIAE